MLSRQVIETGLVIGAVVCFLGCDVAIWWMMVSGEVGEYRRAYRQWMMGKWLEEIGGEVGDGDPARTVGR